MYSFPKESRLRKSKEFLFVQRRGRKVYASHVQFLVHRSTYCSQVRMGLTVSAKYGNAVQRNLFKRRHRNIYRQLRSEFPSGWMIHIRPIARVKKSQEVPSYKDLEKDWRKILDQINLWSADPDPVLCKESSREKRGSI